jgi:hypothetical protein
MSDIRQTAEQFAGLLDAVRKLADIDDLEAATQRASDALKKAEGELESYLAQRERTAKAANREAETELDRKRRDNDNAIRVAKEVQDKYVTDEQRKLHLARERLKTEQDAWARSQADREATIVRLEAQVREKQADARDQHQLLGQMRDAVAAEQKKLRETREALHALQQLLGAAPQAA